MTETALSDEQPRTAFAHYAAAVCAVAAGLTLRFAIAPFMGSKAHMTFIPEITLAAWSGGIGPSLLATALRLLAADYFVVSPLHRFGFDHPSDVISVISFLAVSAFISIPNEALRRSRARSEERVQQLARETDRRRIAEELLEQRVVERTAELKAPVRFQEQILRCFRRRAPETRWKGAAWGLPWCARISKSSAGQSLLNPRKAKDVLFALRGRNNNRRRIRAHREWRRSSAYLFPAVKETTEYDCHG